MSQGPGGKAPAKFICCMCLLVHFWASPDINLIKKIMFFFSLGNDFSSTEIDFAARGKIAEMGRVLQSLQDHFH